MEFVGQYGIGVRPETRFRSPSLSRIVSHGARFAAEVGVNFVGFKPVRTVPSRGRLVAIEFEGR